MRLNIRTLLPILAPVTLHTAPHRVGGQAGRRGGEGILAWRGQGWQVAPPELCTVGGAPAGSRWVALGRAGSQGEGVAGGPSRRHCPTPTPPTADMCLLCVPLSHGARLLPSSSDAICCPPPPLPATSRSVRENLAKVSSKLSRKLRGCKVTRWPPTDSDLYLAVRESVGGRVSDVPGVSLCVRSSSSSSSTLPAEAARAAQAASTDPSGGNATAIEAISERLSEVTSLAEQLDRALTEARLDPSAPPPPPSVEDSTDAPGDTGTEVTSTSTTEEDGQPEAEQRVDDPQPAAERSVATMTEVSGARARARAPGR